MCPPDFYGIEYEINPWMSRSRQSDVERSREQWRALYELLVSLGADVRLMQPVAGLPDLVFTANAGLVYRRKVFLSRFRHPARQGETSIDQVWFHQNGFETVELPAHWNFEGAGDALFCGDTLFAGYLIRSDAGAMQWVAGEIYYPGAFDEYGRKALAAHVPTLIEVSDEEAARFACNAVVLGQHVVTNTGCPQLAARLADLGYQPHETPLDEFIKAGGSAKCLTLRLDGEDAASWRLA
jgi:N-dimethylarginine dimethylaminohydrolase